MKILGIVCEYNPLHNGHIHHLTQSLKESFEKIGNWFKGLVGKKTDKNSASEKDCKSEKSETDKDNNTESKE